MPDPDRQPLVSVVLPTFNRPDYLRLALASALAQTYRNLEVLVCDNASGEETVRVIRSFSDPRLEHHRRPENIGMTGNILGGFRAARGKYVANLHDDDLWEPLFLERLVPLLEGHPEAVLAFSDHYIIDAEGAIDAEKTERNTRLFARDSLAPGMHRPFHRLALVDLAIPMVTSALIRRGAVDWQDFPQLECAYDFWLLYLTSRTGLGAWYVPERLARYRVHAQSESALGRARLNAGFIQCYRRILEDERFREFHRIFRRRMARHHTFLGVELLKQGRGAEARPHLWTGMTRAPGWRTAGSWMLGWLPGSIRGRTGGAVGRVGAAAARG